MKRCLLGLALVFCCLCGLWAGGKKEIRPVKVGMATDGGIIGDRSFNQGLWEGVLKAQQEYGFEAMYIETPSGSDDIIRAQAVDDLANAGCTLILCPGSSFGTVLGFAQDLYPAISFIQFDGKPKHISDNLLSVSWAEESAAFLAAAAASVQVKEGIFGCVAGGNIPPVQRYESGWREGIAYANAQLGTHITYDDTTLRFLDSFHDPAAGKTEAESLFSQDVRVIFSVAGGSGQGIIDAAREHMVAGDTRFVVGSDTDQFMDGVLPDHHSSVVLTSAMKYLSDTTYGLVRDMVKGVFSGGQAIVLSTKNHGMGLPSVNPTLSKQTLHVVKQIQKRLDSEPTGGK